MHRTHAGRLVGGVLGCARCGGLATTVLNKLLEAPCRTTCPDGSRSRLMRITSGELPHELAEWPDGIAAANQRRSVLHLEHKDGRWRTQATAETIASQQSREARGSKPTSLVS